MCQLDQKENCSERLDQPSDINEKAAGLATCGFFVHLLF